MFTGCFYGVEGYVCRERNESYMASIVCVYILGELVCLVVPGVVTCLYKSCVWARLIRCV